MKSTSSILGVAYVLVAISCVGGAEPNASFSDTSIGPARANDRPNFIVILTDDQGFGDLGCFGSSTIKTPHLDRLAREGRKYTSFYVACSVCSPSRAALLTGCYPKRVGMHRHVLFPQSKYGLNAREYTIADHLKTMGYATACVGKWHLGHHPEVLPTANGFDSYYGIPYSNDMNHPDNKRNGRRASDELWKNQKSSIEFWNTPLMRGTKIVELPTDQRTITRRYTDEAIAFVKDHKDEPFFLYLPHSMPHIPLYVPDDVYDPEVENAYTCVIEHIDAEVGRLVQTIRDLGLSKRTFVLFTSDNGPWLQFKNHGGSAGPLRSGKGTTFEGGQRVPCIMWGPDRIPAGTSTQAFTSTMDILPMIAAMTSSALPAHIAVDGLNIVPTFDSDDSPRNEMVFYSSRGELEGIRVGGWKYLSQRPRKKRNETQRPPAREYLFQLGKDLGEDNNVLNQHPEIVQRLKKRMMEVDEDLTTRARPVWRKDKDANE